MSAPGYTWSQTAEHGSIKILTKFMPTLRINEVNENLTHFLTVTVIMLAPCCTWSQIANQRKKI